MHPVRRLRAQQAGGEKIPSTMLVTVGCAFEITKVTINEPSHTCTLKVRHD